MSVRYRVRWSKEGRTRFVSARDQSSIWERAIRRAALPIASSEGFTPHARVSFPDALPVGVASTGEYAELTFAAPIRADDPDRLRGAAVKQHRRLEKIGLGSINRRKSGPHHGHELFGCLEDALDVRAGKAEGRDAIIAGEGGDLAVDHDPEGACCLCVGLCVRR